MTSEPMDYESFGANKMNACIRIQSSAIIDRRIESNVVNKNYEIIGQSISKRSFLIMFEWQSVNHNISYIQD